MSHYHPQHHRQQQTHSHTHGAHGNGNGHGHTSTTVPSTSSTSSSWGSSVGPSVLNRQRSASITEGAANAAMAAHASATTSQHRHNVLRSTYLGSNSNSNSNGSGEAMSSGGIVPSSRVATSSSIGGATGTGTVATIGRRPPSAVRRPAHHRSRSQSRISSDEPTLLGPSTYVDTSSSRIRRSATSTMSTAITNNDQKELLPLRSSTLPLSSPNIVMDGSHQIPHLPAPPLHVSISGSNGIDSLRSYARPLSAVRGPTGTGAPTLGSSSAATDTILHMRPTMIGGGAGPPPASLAALRDIHMAMHFLDRKQFPLTTSTSSNNTSSAPLARVPSLVTHQHQHQLQHGSPKTMTRTVNASSPRRQSPTHANNSGAQQLHHHQHASGSQSRISSAIAGIAAMNGLVPTPFIAPTGQLPAVRPIGTPRPFPAPLSSISTTSTSNAASSSTSSSPSTTSPSDSPKLLHRSLTDGISGNGEFVIHEVSPLNDYRTIVHANAQNKSLHNNSLMVPSDDLSSRNRSVSDTSISSSTSTSNRPLSARSQLLGVDNNNTHDTISSSHILDPSRVAIARTGAGFTNTSSGEFVLHPAAQTTYTLKARHRASALAPVRALPSSMMLGNNTSSGHESGSESSDYHHRSGVDMSRTQPGVGRARRLKLSGVNVGWADGAFTSSGDDTDAIPRQQSLPTSAIASASRLLPAPPHAVAMLRGARPLPPPLIARPSLGLMRRPVSAAWTTSNDDDKWWTDDDTDESTTSTSINNVATPTNSHDASASSNVLPTFSYQPSRPSLSRPGSRVSINNNNDQSPLIPGSPVIIPTSILKTSHSRPGSRSVSRPSSRPPSRPPSRPASRVGSRLSHTTDEKDESDGNTREAMIVRLHDAPMAAIVVEDQSGSGGAGEAITPLRRVLSHRGSRHMPGRSFSGTRLVNADGSETVLYPEIINQLALSFYFIFFSNIVICL
jgi:hypothetical protein